MMKFIFPLCTVLLCFFIACTLQGCQETKADKEIRLSCHWNTDLAVKGCDRVDFKNCVDTCEYCQGRPGSPDVGKSDSCAQLKCAAYCAKQDGEACLSTYAGLCTEGVEYLRADDIACDVNCNAAPRGASRTGLFVSYALAAAACLRWLPLRSDAAGRTASTVAANTSFTPRSFLRMKFMLPLCTVLLCFFIACTLQGCEFCPPVAPTLSWAGDLEHLDFMAGCKNGWNVIWGNPCASDVPFPFTKKGYIQDTDEKWMREHVENEEYECTEWAGGESGRYCRSWTTMEHSCDEEDFGVCQCMQESANKQYCATWTCVSLEATQNECWKACCGDNCEPCVVCGGRRSSPFPMTQPTFLSLLRGNMHYDGRLLQDLRLNVSQMTKDLRSNLFVGYKFGSECIMPRDITTVYETTCDRWREIEPEISVCWCNEEEDAYGFCKKWTCEEKDVGMFSVLFSGTRSYAAELIGQETELYECLQERLIQGTWMCTKWKGDISGYEEAELTQCQCMDGIESCDKWLCNEYGLPRVHDEDRWGQRFGFTIVHLIWISVFAYPVPLMIVLRRPSLGSSGSVGKRLTDSLAMLFTSVVVVVLIWLVGYVRGADEEDTPARASTLALGGVALVIFGAGFLTSILGLTLGCEALLLVLIFEVTLWCACFFWTSGIVGLAIVIAVPGACLFFLYCPRLFVWCKEKAGVQSPKPLTSSSTYPYTPKEEHNAEAQNLS